MTRPFSFRSRARSGRTRKVTSAPDSTSRPPKYPPVPPAPRIRMRMLASRSGQLVPQNVPQHRQDQERVPKQGAAGEGLVLDLGEDVEPLGGSRQGFRNQLAGDAGDRDPHAGIAVRVI